MEFDPDLLREWGQMLQSIGEEMLNVANALDPPDSYLPNTEPVGVLIPDMISAEEYEAVRAGIIYLDDRANIVPKGPHKAMVAPHDERPDYTFAILPNMNRENFMRDPIRNRDRGKVIHIKFGEMDSDALKVRLL
jgi:hypothetical protein